MTALGTRVPTLGLTGGIGSGKSTVAGLLVECGAHLVDTDAIARSLTAPGGAAMPALAEAFGARAVGADGALDRSHMRGLAFTDPDARERLEAILHPLIATEALRRAAAHGGRPVVYDVPLLAESLGPRSWRLRVDRVLVVDCSEATQHERVRRRPGWTDEAAGRVIAQQATRAARRAVADAVIFNDGLALEALAAEVRAVWLWWLASLAVPRAADPGG